VVTFSWLLVSSVALSFSSSGVMAYRNQGVPPRGTSPNPGAAYNSGAGGAHQQIPQVQQPAMNAYGAQYSPQAGYGGGSNYGAGGGGPPYGYNPAQGGFGNNQGEM
jgi:hypothetical protein